jgi:hypothetical protein
MASMQDAAIPDDRDEQRNRASDGMIALEASQGADTDSGNAIKRNVKRAAFLTPTLAT